MCIRDRPFLASALLLFVGLYVRSRLEESPEFEKVSTAGRVSSFPLRDTLRRSPRAVLVGIFTQAAANIPFYVVTVFVLSYATTHVGISRGTVLTCLIIAALLDIAAVPLVAILADRIGRRKVLRIGAIYSAVAAFPFFWLVDTGSTVGVLVAMILYATLGHALTYGAIAGFLSELFDANHRYTGVSVAYQVGGLITSGPAPFIAAALYAGFSGSWVIALYIVIACAVTYVALLAAPRT